MFCFTKISDFFFILNLQIVRFLVEVLFWSIRSRVVSGEILELVKSKDHTIIQKWRIPFEIADKIYQKHKNL